MFRKCPICASPQLDEINQYIDADRFNYEEMKKIFKADFNLEVSNYQIRNHKLKHKNSDSTIINNSKITKSALANFDIYLAKYGLTREDLLNLDKIDTIIEASQKLLISSYFLNACLLEAKLESALERQAPYPRDEIAGLEKIYNMLEKNAGLKMRIDANTAIQSLESQGYRIVED